MNPAQIIAKVRKRTFVNSSQYSDQDALDDLNLLKDEIWSMLCGGTNADYYYQTWYADLIPNQEAQPLGEYTLLAPTSTNQGQKLIKTLSVCYDGQTYPQTGGLRYWDADLVDPNGEKKDWSWYLAYQPQHRPLYFIGDQSVFISPLPTIFIPNGLKITGLRNIPDYTLNESESSMAIPVDFHAYLVEGLIPYAKQAKGLDDAQVRAAFEDWDKVRLKFKGQISQRHAGALLAEMPDEGYTNDDGWLGHIY